MTPIKTAVYRNFGSGTSRVAYVIDGDKVYFCGLNPRGSSTINAASRVIEAIAAKERLPWPGLEFYDIQTRRGYQGKPPGWFEIDRIHFRPSHDDDLGIDRPVVECWEPVGGHPHFRKLRGVPEHIMAMFRRFIA